MAQFQIPVSDQAIEKLVETDRATGSQFLLGHLAEHRVETGGARQVVARAPRYLLDRGETRVGCQNWNQQSDILSPLAERRPTEAFQLFGDLRIIGRPRGIARHGRDGEQFEARLEQKIGRLVPFQR